MRRPLSGALLGIIIGLAAAVILQQQGIWPLDRILVFLLPGLVGLLGILLASIGREGSMATMIVALVITIPLVSWGAIGLGEINEQGELNGGCTVVAASDVDSTNVTDTSRGDPFEIDPDGGLTWAATSPQIFDDYPWEIWTEIGGVQVTLDSEEMQNNDSGSTENGGDVDNVTEYADSRGISIDQIRGVIIVGGEAADTCDGFGFVELTSDPFGTLASQIALGVLLLALIALALVIFTGRGTAAAAGSSAVADSGGSDSGTGPEGAAAAGAAAGEATIEGEEDEDKGQEFIEDIENAADESGFGRHEKP